MIQKMSAEKWETFINAKDPQFKQMSTQQLYAEVRVDAARNKSGDKATDTPLNEAKVHTTDLR